MLEMQDALKDLAKDKDIGCVVLTGSQKAFAGTFPLSSVALKFLFELNEKYFKLA